MRWLGAAVDSVLLQQSVTSSDSPIHPTRSCSTLTLRAAPQFRAVHTKVNTLGYTHFEWDDAKNRRNLKQHGVSFSAATTLFEQPHLVRLDSREGYGEDRWIAVGWIGGVVGVVIFTDRVDDQHARTIRIISARKATNRERKMYEKEFGH